MASEDLYYWRIKMKASHALSVAAGFLFFLAACIAPLEAPKARDGQRRITILYTHGVEGQLQPCG
ncbi:MAG: hypothetical protein JW821_17135 [Deltaproteobacteria bacterium]|nr:hypothetical protein [Deltaproteobacteria bacterium]